MPCTVCHQTGHNRTTCAYLRASTSLWYTMDEHFVGGRFSCIKFKGIRVDNLEYSRHWMLDRTRHYDHCLALSSAWVRHNRNKALVDYWQKLQNRRWSPYGSFGGGNADLIYTRANIRLVNAFATKLQRWFRSLEELPMACPCAEEV